MVPNSSLEPEYAYGCELGLNININSSILIDVSSYYTHLDNAITRDFISINGVSEIFYDGELCQTQAVQNSSEARIYGFEAGIKARLSNSFQITSQYSLTKGRQKIVGILMLQFAMLLLNLATYTLFGRVIKSLSTDF